MADKHDSRRDASQSARGSASLLLECRRRCVELEADLSALRQIMEFSRSVAGDLDKSHLLDSIMKAAVRLTGAERGFLVLAEPDGAFQIEASYGYDESSQVGEHVRYSRTVVKNAIENRESVLTTDASEDERFAEAKSVQIGALRAVMAVPIPGIDGPPIGAVYVDHTMQSGCFDQRTLLLLQGLSHQVAAAIRTAQLHEAVMREDELCRAATTDPLTRIPNRRWLFERAVEDLSFAERHGTPLSIVMLDIDYFKKINDTYGHQGGDYVLMTLAGMLLEAKRQEDMVCRYGGEEFLVMLRGTAAPDALAFCERLRVLIEDREFGFGGTAIRMTVSMGVADHRVGDTLDSLIGRADKALYVAKNAGRNRVVIEEPAE
jgi:diguanylate cyclase (GGDEF)-like protein